MKKNIPKKNFGGLELSFNRVKIFNQPTKITLMTDCFHSISNNTYVPCHEKPPDPNVIDGLRGHVK